MYYGGLSTPPPLSCLLLLLHQFHPFWYANPSCFSSPVCTKCRAEAFKIIGLFWSESTGITKIGSEKTRSQGQMENLKVMRLLSFVQCDQIWNFLLLWQNIAIICPFIGSFFQCRKWPNIGQIIQTSGHTVYVCLCQINVLSLKRFRGTF